VRDGGREVMEEGRGVMDGVPGVMEGGHGGMDRLSDWTRGRVPPSIVLH